MTATRIWTFASLVVLVPIGFYSKLYDGPGHPWVNNSLGGILYVIFWCLFGYLVFPRARPRAIIVTVFIVTCILECLQPWQANFLEAIRSTFIGRTLIGTTFTWTDFPYYVIGCAISGFWIRILPGQRMVDPPPN